VALEELAREIAAWVRAQLRPKLVLATQTKVVEVAVDERGDVVPSTPVVAIHAPAEQLWALAAALSAPPVSAAPGILRRGAVVRCGQAPARQVLALPPADRGAGMTPPRSRRARHGRRPVWRSRRTARRAGLRRPAELLAVVGRVSRRGVQNE
jgi:hypothetical protein